ncbi:mucin-associated surface protein [Trypanosoma cruzi cruzi]|uniref:Mucin-associated surface protein (MASP) n=1 Tax=Trypanosoma cruzi TaxID=5693 RepID=A0A2V2V1R1_TRYCR|nr:mucin-associated surface protein [Trypanosoma cruzi cruzi]PBJ80136.1 mucin-associated surface protein [Trypanosoma cruzi cruzi]PBJ81213.1 mucin-associated surface protein [Trypanosoma cruzi cruzi]PWU89446.1 Mucin-associated surface protein (MASP) [Trypanosoma cruzi]PWU89448.1 Mucin-associated surface protein (MASP) [Trypanosoma cruzi]
MAMMMTGRVLLVCALCVLWCVAGGRCDEEERAGDTPDGLSGASLNGETQPTEPKALSQVPDSLNLPSKPQRNEESERLPPKESLKANEENSFERPVVSEVEPIQEETAEQLSESEEDLLETQKEEKKTQVVQDEVQNGNQSTPHAQSTNQALQPSVESHAASPGGPSDGVKDSLVSPSSGVIPLPHGDGDRGITGSIPSNLQSTFPKAAAPTGSELQELSPGPSQATQPGGASVTSSTTTDSKDQNAQEDKKEEEDEQEEEEDDDKKEKGDTRKEEAVTDAAEGTSTGGQEQPSLSYAAEGTSNITNPNSTQTTGDDDPTADFAGTREEKQNENKDANPKKTPVTATAMKTTTATTGDSDGSTAVSHTTSPLLLLLIVVSCAAAVVAA